MSNFGYEDSGDIADRFYAQDVRADCDVCEDDEGYALMEFGPGGCPDCGCGDTYDDVAEDAGMEYGLFRDC